jgi:hypothetical protein
VSSVAVDPPSTESPTASAQALAGAAASPRGTARISGRAGCQADPFHVVVTGRQVARVIFALDGSVVRHLKRPNGGRYELLVDPGTLSSGEHRVLARVSFRRESATRARTLRAAFRRCGTGA